MKIAQCSLSHCTAQCTLQVCAQCTVQCTVPPPTVHCSSLLSASLSHQLAPAPARHWSLPSRRYQSSGQCTALHCTALHCTALHYTALLCTALHCTANNFNALHNTELHSSKKMSFQVKIGPNASKRNFEEEFAAQLFTLFQSVQIPIFVKRQCFYLVRA